MKTFKKIPSLTIVGLSRWLADCAKKSTLFGERHIVNLPNPIDIHIFRPFNKEFARDLLDLPVNNKIVLFGADDAMRDPRKGFTELAAAMNSIKSTGLELLLFGSGRLSNPPDFNHPVHFLGHMPGDLSLRVLYSAADVMVVPSLQENLSNIIMECLACGTPVVAFNIGGNSDMIDHQNNGYLAIPRSPSSLAEGIDWILNHPTPQHLSCNARQKVIENFESTKIARQYLNLYNEILNTRR
jgi:glycosyltransferase involved in cell wall biosynthesis